MDIEQHAPILAVIFFVAFFFATFFFVAFFFAAFFLTVMRFTIVRSSFLRSKIVGAVLRRKATFRLMTEAGPHSLSKDAPHAAFKPLLRISIVFI